MQIKSIIKALNVLLDGVLIIILTIFFYLGLEIKTTYLVAVPQGSISFIVTSLSKNGFDINQLDKYILRFFGKPQSGIIAMGAESISKGDFLYNLTNAKAAQNTITLIPGETMYFFIKDIANKLGLDEQKLWEAFRKYAPYDEGLIMPNTYNVPLHIDEDTLMKILVEQSLRIHKNLATTLLGAYNEEQWLRYIVMASIVQKEAANKKEMPLVAAVIYNRLQKGMPLQMDGSLNYGEYSHTKITAQRIRSDTSPYNTYKNKGIPPLPVGSASIDAIKAVIAPANVDYLYFVRNKDGVHTFSKTYQEHRNNIK